ncbi:MAG: LicD family protein [SAR202 cluster bacterium]|jgi:hypothetical protein|nr:LicD family protein [SAR202 cluster bacterium]
MVSENGSDEAALLKSFENLQSLDPTGAKLRLKEAKAVMDGFGIPFWLRQGTCLGAVRDNDFIPWDDDIDLGCVIGLNGVTEDQIDPIVDGFRERGYFVEVEYSDREISACMIKNSIRTDLTFFHIIDDAIFHFPMIWMPARLFADLKQIEFTGDSYFVPNPPEEYLGTKYGPNWTTPKQDGYELDVFAQIAKAPAAILETAPGHPQTKIQILDLHNEIVADAEVSIVGVDDARTDGDGRVEFNLPFKDFYAVVIRHGNHEEILYQEIFTPGKTYVYTPDPARPSGRYIAMREE